ncbi:MAG: hypothetical protein BGP22_22160 [Variovorax sp. 67-131]|nr:MAG: hypothetical protein ABS94_02925 [Variovorax sp. SCN 67-85]ODV17995.1 MAG: hypothetical protein ABT25_28785 [Variovorax sp. SCN 67-20]OJZ05703.1 MAG: hypothetical protein BGP22_22160 [Variovorax sp. 67-131]
MKAATRRPVAEVFQHPARVWIGVLAVLLYLILRFKFSDLHAKASEELRTEFDAARLRILKRYAQSQLNRFARGIEAPIFGDALLSKFKHRQMISEMLKHEPNTVVQRKIAGGEVRYDPSRRVGDITFNTTDRYAGGGGSFGETDMVTFEVSHWAHVRFNLQSSLWIAMYSRAATAILLPWGLCFLAMMVSIWRLLQAWWA